MKYSISNVPRIHRPRSRFGVSFDVKTTMNVGTLYPIMWKEVYPGDTWDISAPFVARSTSGFVVPVMDNLYIDYRTFYVPYRTIYSDWQKFITGGDNASNWSQPFSGNIPSWQNKTVPSKSVGDYLGLPTGGSITEHISVLPFRAFAKIYNEYYRSEVTEDEVYIHSGAVSSQEYPNNNAWSVSNYTGQCPKVSKFHDYFTTAHTAPQKGVAQFANVPVVNNGLATRFSFYNGSTGLDQVGSLQLQVDSDGFPVVGFSNPDVGGYLPESLKYVDGLVGNMNVNELRIAFQTQKILESLARTGSRYPEYLLSQFGVESPDARLQRAEYLGGSRTPLMQQQVAQTNRPGTSSRADSVASLSSYSLTNGVHKFLKGFTEHGILMTVAVIRYKHTYQQGIERQWFRRNRFDFYDPTFANIGEQPIYTSQLFAFATKGKIFGYQEAWAELRQFPNMVSGDMRSGSTNSLDMYHYADVYVNEPTLTESWLKETPTYVDRSLVVQSTSGQDTFIIDILFKGAVTRCLPTYSVPSLIDHN